MASPIASQSAAADTVDLDDLPDIAAEQAAAAAQTASADATKMKDEPVDEPVVQQKEQPTKKEDEPYKAPIEKDLGDEGDGLADQFEAAKKGLPIPAAAKKPDVVAAPAKTVIGAVDHTDIDEELRPVFKQMSNAAIEKIKPLILEAKKTKADMAALQTELETAKKAGLPESYQEHEMGYVLSPEFATQSQAVNTSLGVYNHWREQLAALRGGADTYIPLFNDANGNIVTGQPTKADRGTQDQLEDIRDNAHTQYMTHKSKLDSMAETHREKNTQLKSWISGFQAKAFPAFEKNETLKTMIPDTLRSLPLALRSNPLAPMLARAFITIAELGKKLPQLTKPAAATEQVPATKQAQPNAATIAGGGSGNGKPAQLNDDDNLADAFERAKKGLL